jgi:hypothetical protein
MCQELHVELKESPIEIYKTIDEINEDDFNEVYRKAQYNHHWTLDCWSEKEGRAEVERIWKENGNFFRILNEVTKAVIEDVDGFVNSYNYHDCDGMIDYFDVDFYYFGCAQNNGMDIKVVPKTARIKAKETKPTRASNAATKPEPEATPEQIETAKEKRITYKITRGEDTRDGSELWLVRINETLSRDEYIAENAKMKKRGGYYSKFRHAFIFREDPTDKITA